MTVRLRSRVLDWEIDLFEVSIVPAPANADTRILALNLATDAHKRADGVRELQAADHDRGDDHIPDESDQRRRLALLTNRTRRIQEQERDRMLKLLDESDSKAIESSVKTQQPVRIASFEC